MRAELNHLLIALLLVLGVVVPARTMLAFDINDLLGDVEFTTTQTKQGLDGYYTQECKVNVTENIKRIKSGYSRQLISDVLKDFKDTQVRMAAQLAICLAQNSIPIPPGGPIAWNTCVNTVGDQAASMIKRQAMDTMEKRFMTRCTADSMLRQVDDDIRRIAQENGPEGGAAYITDWINDIYVDPDQRAINRFNAILVNTPICEDFKEAVYAYYDVPQSYIDNPPALTGLGLRVDGGASFNQTAACTRPAGLTPEKLDEDFLGNGGFEAMEILREPQNNFTGFIQMANAELRSQRAIAVAAAEARAIAGGGFTGTYAECHKDPNGKCLADGVQQQPPGGLRDANAATFQGKIAWIANSKEMNDLMGDVRLRLVSMILDMQQKALDYDIEVDPGAKDYIDIADDRKQPDDVSALPVTQPGTDPNDPLCTGGNPQCLCVRGAPELEGLRQRVAEATRAAIQIHPEYVSPDGSSVVPGSERLFLQAICETTIGQALNCHPHPEQNDEIVVGSDVTISVHVIQSSGTIRIPGQTIASCQAGVQ